MLRRQYAAALAALFSDLDGAVAARMDLSRSIEERLRFRSGHRGRGRSGRDVHAPQALLRIAFERHAFHCHPAVIHRAYSTKLRRGNYQQKRQYYSCQIENFVEL